MTSWLFPAVFLIYLLAVALLAFVLFWVVRLGVRFGLRDHDAWAEKNKPKSE